MTNVNIDDIEALDKPWPCDPKQLAILLTGQELGIVVNALGEVPAKFSRRLLEKIEEATRSQTREARRAYVEQIQAQDQERIRAADERRLRRQEKNAARALRQRTLVNGVEQPPQPEAT